MWSYNKYRSSKSCVNLNLEFKNSCPEVGSGGCYKSCPGGGGGGGGGRGRNDISHVQGGAINLVLGGGGGGGGNDISHDQVGAINLVLEVGGVGGGEE